MMCKSSVCEIYLTPMLLASHRMCTLVLNQCKLLVDGVPGVMNCLAWSWYEVPEDLLMMMMMMMITQTFP